MIRDCFGFNNIGINILLDILIIVIDNCRALNSTALSGIYPNNSLGLGTKNIIKPGIARFAHNEQARLRYVAVKNLIVNNIIYRNNLRGTCQPGRNSYNWKYH